MNLTSAEFVKRGISHISMSNFCDEQSVIGHNEEYRGNQYIIFEIEVDGVMNLLPKMFSGSFVLAKFKIREIHSVYFNWHFDCFLD